MADVTLNQEIEKFGEVRDGGCTLKIENGAYVMEVQRNVMIKHLLDIQNTSEERLEAHWKGFVEANR